MRQTKIDLTTLFPLVGLFLLSLSLHLLTLGAVRHGYDQGYQAFLALRWLDGHQWLWIGQPSSVFIDNAPLMAYLQAIPLALWRSVWSPYLFVTLLNATGAGWVFALAKQLTTRKAAFFCGLVWAINPWLIHFGRFPWTQGLFSFFMALCAWGVWPTLLGRKQPRRFFIGLLSAIALAQSYVLALALFAPLGLLLLIYYRRLPMRPMVWAGVIAVIGFALYGYGLTTNAKLNNDRFGQFVGKTAEIDWDGVALQHTLRYVTGQDFNGQGESSDYVPATRLMQGITTGFGMAILLGSVVLVRKNRPMLPILFIWAGLPTLALSFLPFLVHPHYLMLTLPVLHLLAGMGLAAVTEWRFGRWVVISFLVLATGEFTLNQFSAANQVAAHPTWGKYDSWQLSDAAKLGAIIRHYVNDPIMPQRIVADTQSSNLSSLSATYLTTMRYLNYPEFIQIGEHDSILYLLLNRPIEPEIVWQRPLPDQLRLSDGTTINFMQTLPQTAASARLLPTVPIDLPTTSGLQLLGYSAEFDQRTHTLTTFWRVESLAAERHQWYVTFFYHLLNDQRQIVVNTNAQGVWGYDWREGDLLISKVALTAPDDRHHTISFGLYDPIHNLNFPLQIGDTQQPNWEIEK